MLRARDYQFPLGKRTYVMGVLNYTADSFSDGGLYNTPEAAAACAQAMQAAGADKFAEFGPGKTLTGLVKKTLSGVTAWNVENMETLEKGEEYYG